MVYVSGGTGLLNPSNIFQRISIQQGMNVADLGCGGSGYFTICVAKLVGKNGTVYAVDILKSTLQEISKKALYKIAILLI